MFESIVRIKNVIINPTAVEICSPIVYHDYTTNYGGPLRKSDQITNNNSFQHKATVLINVCYRLYARIEQFRYVPKSLAEAARLESLANVNSQHACQDMFYRRLKKGQFYDIPCLGWREFVPDYIGPIRSDTENRKRQTTIKDTLPSFYIAFLIPKPVFALNYTSRARKVVE